jgi:cytochrome c biogenesis protein CcmG, thiol:disulfide interchange protein DsbE
MRRALLALAAVAVVAAVAIGLSQTGTDNSKPESAGLSLADARRSLAGAPAPLAALHAQSNELLQGSADAVEERLAGLRGYPVVVNKWASWCAPCRFEFPFFQRVSARLGKQVAFLGLNSGDNSGDAREFLAAFPVSYPSYEDPAEKTARKLGAAAAYPVTIYYDARGGRAFVHQGGYPSQERLLADVERYALGRGS